MTKSINEIRRMTTEESLTSIDTTKLIDTVREKYSTQYDEMYLTTENIEKHIESLATQWVSALKIKTVNRPDLPEDLLPDAYNTFEDCVYDKISENLSFDAAYFDKLHRLPDANPFRTEEEARIIYETEKDEYDNIANIVRDEILNNYPENAAIYYALQDINLFIIKCIMYYDVNSKEAVKVNLYDEIVVPATI